MCTLTYIPYKNNGFILTTNRDESGLRPTVSPMYYNHKGEVLLYPRDLEASGTWMASNGSNTTICLLNGAFVRHQREMKYRKSRGVMALEYFGYSDTLEFIRDYYFKGIEPFTLIVVKHDNSVQLQELRWDGTSIHFRVLPESDPLMWSSATLYPQNIWKKRESWFKDWLETKFESTQNSILEFHHNGGGGDERNDLIMNRDGKVMTVSITSIKWEDAHLELYYEDLLNDKISHFSYRKDNFSSNPFQCAQE
jgi:hypothetical protein